MSRITNQVRTFALMAALTAAIAAAGSLLGPTAAIAGLVAALGLNLAAYFYADRIVLRAGGARAVAPGEAPELEAMLAELSARAGVPRPRLYVVDDDAPNAFATGRNPANGVVAVTTGLLRDLTPREVRAVLAHELAHIKNRDVLVATIAAGMAAAIGWLATALSLSSLFGDGGDEHDDAPATGFLFMLLAPIGATLVQLGISRTREYLADAEGARIAGDPEGLAGALERLDGYSRQRSFHAPLSPEPATASLQIINPFHGKAGIAAWFSTHPPISERVRRLRTMGVATAGVPRNRRSDRPSAVVPELFL